MIQETIKHRELIWNLVSRELKVRYHGAALGFAWTLLVPLFMAGIYVVFLQLLGGRSVPVAEIIIGVFAWQFTTQCVTSGQSAITGNVNLVKKVFFPRFILPLAATLANLVNFLLSLLIQFPVVFIMMRMHDQPFSGQLWAFPLIIVLQFVFNLGLTLLISGAVVYFRDLQHIIGVLLSAWFFVSPVMYNLEFVRHFAAAHPTAASLYMLNPMSVVITAYRAVSIPGVALPMEWPSWVALGVCVGMFFAGKTVFERLQKNFADML